MLRVLEVVLCLMLASVSARAQGLPGDWMGTLDAGPIKLRLVFHITENEKGLAATLDSLDQNAKGLPVSSVTLNGAAVKLEMPQIGAVYEGQRSADGARIDGTFTQQGQRMPLVLTRVTNAAQLERPRPQMPVKPYPYREEDVTIDNASAGVRLAGTLTVPQGQGPFTAVVLISGSGPQDRNESLMGHAPFLVLADYLTRKGIAVLRYDDRGFGKSTGAFATATTADFATDAEAALTYLGTRAEIASRKIGLIGHSEGGVIAPMVAARNTQVAFMVLMAGTGVRGDEVLVAQAAAIVESMGAPKATVDQVTVRQRETLALVKTETDDAALIKKLQDANPGADAQIAGQVRQMRSPWFRYFLDYDPAAALRKVTVPVLAINGEKDRQVIPSQNLPAIRTALAAAGNKNVEIVEFAGLNHLFQTAKTGAPGEYGDIEETMAPAVLDTIAKWVSQR
jgi:pimeloyl-ACP methyl ester carboxylesterase